MKIINKLFFSLSLTFLAATVLAHSPLNDDNKGVVRNNSELLNSRMDCVQGMAETFMDVNNVRATLLTGGDVWWNLDDGKYVVPKPAPGELEVSSIFAGGVWIGGFDLGNNLKLAGVTYRTTQGTDYYPGPLKEDGTTDAELCSDWDQFFTINAEDIQRHIKSYEAAVAAGVEYDCDSIPLAVRQWPGRGNPDWSLYYDFDLPDQPLGDFFDNDKDNLYDPCQGDFPFIFIEKCPTDERDRAKELVPDQMVYWIYNDNGGPHFNSRATAIQMEVQVQAFAYATNDELNDMTFQRYRLINKAQSVINRCYFAMWVDPDLGCSDDDFIGCRIDESLMYVYNEDNVDGIQGAACQLPGGGSTNTYGSDVPILGVDYFRGPFAPKVYLRDNEGNVLPDSILVNPPAEDPLALDTLVELGMTSFTYFNRIDPTTGDPTSGEEYYNYLTGRWRDGTPFTFGGNGYNPGSIDSIAYAFPGDPDDANAWSMCTADLPFDDRRTVQATGPLTLQPTAINELIIGVVWVPNIDYPCPNLEPLLSADVLAQNLFDACFDITDGPDAPDMCAIELDREIILVLSNDTIDSNNKFLTYAEADLRSNEIEDTINTGPRDSLYRFEGYRIFQLVEAGVSVSELDDPSRALQVAQVDIQNGVSSVSNWFSTLNPDPTLPSAFFPVEQVDGADGGIRHTFQILNDAFASGDDTRLINHKRYYYTVISYAYNNFKSFNQQDRTGQRTPYLEGRRNVDTYTFVPRPIVYDSLVTEYGFGPRVTRVSGQGSGGVDIQISKEERERIITDGDSYDGRLSYNIGAAPVDVRIFDPFAIKNKRYRLEIKGTLDSQCTYSSDATWVLTDIESGRQFFSETDLSVNNEQVIYGEGFSLTVNQVAEPTFGLNLCDTDDPGFLQVVNNGAVGQTAVYDDPIQINSWYEIMPEQLIFQTQFGNNIINNDYVIDGSTPDMPFEADPDGDFAELGSNFFQPFYHMSNRDGVIMSPAAQDFNLPIFQREQFCQNRRLDTLKLKDLNNVDIVFTPNKDLWSRCIVVEGANSANLQGTPTIGNVDQFELRQSNSVDRNGNEDGDGIGMGWFPGYAVDVESGQRLNIFFAENSSVDIGTDMIWNPDDRLGNTENGFLELIAAGNHYVYVTRTEYDECAAFRTFLDGNPGRGDVSAVTAQITWASFPKLIGGQALLPIGEGLIPNELTVSCRVNNPFGPETIVDQDDINACAFYEGNPIYEFSFEDVAPLTLNAEQIENALSNVLVVPNPYYAFSAYESSSFDNKVKVTNLPAQAIVTIYTLDGKFVRQFNRDEQISFKRGNNPAILQNQVFPDLEWDLNNFAGVPVSSGVYIFHVEDPVNKIERSIKWFGVKRRFDPSGL